jgi:hypothetical protein
MSEEERYIEVDIGLRDLARAVDAHGLRGPMVWAQAILDAVPEEFRDRASIFFDDDYETGWRFDLHYTRPKTALDHQNDEREERERRAKQSAEEYAQYERLRAKYEKR